LRKWVFLMTALWLKPLPQNSVLNRIFVILLAAITLVSCDSSVVYSDYQDLSDNLEWRRTDVRSFEIEVAENLTPYEHQLIFRHATGYPYSHILLRITEVQPNGDVVTRDERILVRDEAGKFEGKADGDLVDITYILDKSRNFKSWGKYKFTVEHTMPRDTVHLALEVGMVLRKLSAEK